MMRDCPVLFLFFSSYVSFLIMWVYERAPDYNHIGIFIILYLPSTSEFFGVVCVISVLGIVENLF